MKDVYVVLWHKLDGSEEVCGIYDNIDAAYEHAQCLEVDNWDAWEDEDGRECAGVRAYGIYSEFNEGGQ